MTAPALIAQQTLIDALQRCVLDGPGDTPARLRQAAAARAAGGGPMDEPFDALARQIGEAAYRVTDAQVEAVVQKLGERAAFELIVAAATGAGLHRWRRGVAVLEEATRAPA